MSVLSPTELRKPYNKNDKNNLIFNYRGEKFLDKINKEESFELTDGSFTTICKSSKGRDYLEDNKYDELGGGKKLFLCLGGIWRSLSEFKKNKEFGSSSGIGGGSINTLIQESTQCVFNAISHNLKKEKIDIIDITTTNISNSYNFVKTTTSLEDIYEFSNSNWQQSLLTSSNILYSYISSSGYNHHVNSKFIKSIYDSYKKTNINYQLNKWNPSDIWFVLDSALNTQFSASLCALNDQIKTMFLNKELIGVSLKKINKNPKLEIKNMEKAKEYKFINHNSSINNKGVDILYNGGKISFRTFNDKTNWAGEIIGENARHGKIGLNPLNNILEKYNIKLDNCSYWLKELQNKRILILTTICILLREYSYNFNNIEDFNIFISNKSDDWIISKLVGLKLLFEIKYQPEEIKHQIISSIINYASSELDESSVFLKLY